MKKTIMALTLVVFICAMGTAHADPIAYAVSWDNVYDGFINAVAADANSTIQATLASDSAAAGSTLNGTPGTAGCVGCISGTNSIGVPVINQIGTSPTVAAADMSQIGLSTTTDYAIGQAEIVSNQTATPGSTFQSVNKAEANVAAPPSGFATAGGDNTSSSNVVVQIVVGGTGGTINFSAFAAPYMYVILQDGPFLPGSQAVAFLTANVSIFHIDPNTGQTIEDFTWAPDGEDNDPGGVVGGNEIFDPFTLNTTITALPFTPGPFTYDPTGNGAGLIGDLSTVGGGYFEVETGLLPAGVYTLQLSMGEHVAVTANAVAQVPEPGTMLLIGTGLLGLVAVSRRKRS